jgi:PAS domain S-box-containing protein
MPRYGKSTLAHPTLEAATRELGNIRQALDLAAIVAVTDPTGTIIHVNDKFCSISQYSREELLGQNHRIINSGYHPREFFISMWKTISSGKVWEAEICNRAKDGSIYWVYTTIVPFLDELNKPYQYVSIRFEITQIKTAQVQLKDYSLKLERSNQELQDFASVAAHDLQEPLRKILTFGDRLRLKYSSDLPQEGVDYLERMVSAAGRMRRLIDDLLSFARIHTKTQPFAKVDLNHVVTEVLSDLEIRIEQSGAKIEVATLPTIDADESQMRQVFQNLISNALKFHKPNVAPHVTVTCHNNFNKTEIKITDNGIGFEEKYLDRIFTIFQRLHGRQEYEGTGVGLAVVRRIVERHRGIVTAHSHLNEGSEFLICLPIHQPKDS